MGGALVVDEISKEVPDAIKRVLSAPEEIRILCAVTFLEAMQQIEENFGRIAELSNDRKRDLAAHLSSVGLNKFETNLGSAYGFFLASAHVAASALPGENAALVLSMTTNYLDKLKALAAEE
jgi:recombinational DNA repair ATPase RecF